MSQLCNSHPGSPSAKVTQILIPRGCAHFGQLIKRSTASGDENEDTQSSSLPCLKQLHEDGRIAQLWCELLYKKHFDSLNNQIRFLVLIKRSTASGGENVVTQCSSVPCLKQLGMLNFGMNFCLRNTLIDSLNNQIRFLSLVLIERSTASGGENDSSNPVLLPPMLQAATWGQGMLNFGVNFCIRNTLIP